FPLLDAQAHGPRQRDIVVENGFQVTAIAAHAGWIPKRCGYWQTPSMTAESRFCQFHQAHLIIRRWRGERLSAFHDFLLIGAVPRPWTDARMIAAGVGALGVDGTEPGLAIQVETVAV